jgi:hypothetical protein
MEAPNGVLDFIAEVTWGDLPQEVRMLTGAETRPLVWRLPAE